MNKPWAVHFTFEFTKVACRTATARGKAEQADYAAVCAREDSGEARNCAKTFAPEFHQPGKLALTLRDDYIDVCLLEVNVFGYILKMS